MVTTHIHHWSPSYDEAGEETDALRKQIPTTFWIQLLHGNDVVNRYASNTPCACCHAPCTFHEHVSEEELIASKYCCGGALLLRLTLPACGKNRKAFESPKLDEDD